MDPGLCAAPPTCSCVCYVTVLCAGLLSPPRYFQMVVRCRVQWDPRCVCPTAQPHECSMNQQRNTATCSAEHAAPSRAMLCRAVFVALSGVRAVHAVQALVPRSSSVVLRRAADSLARVLQPGSPSALPASHRLSPFDQQGSGAKPMHSQVSLAAAAAAVGGSLYELGHE